MFLVNRLTRVHSMTNTRRFAPLNPEFLTENSFRPQSTIELPRLRAVCFDVDGTLCEPQTWMFAKMREVLGITKAQDILNHIYTLVGADQEEAFEKIREVEREAMKAMVPQAGLLDLMDYLDSRGIPKAICTRNFDAPVDHLIQNFMPQHHFHPIITREFTPPKPDPAGILHIAKELGIEGGASSMIMVGDSLDDMTAGRKAGAATVLLENTVNGQFRTHDYTDLVVQSLADLIPILENGFSSREMTAEN